MNWGGDPGVQEHYRAGRKVTRVNRSAVTAVCSCGYIELKPEGTMEEHNGGQMVKRSQVTIIDDRTGHQTRILRSRKDAPLLRYGSCNACVNKWR